MFWRFEKTSHFVVAALVAIAIGAVLGLVIATIKGSITMEAKAVLVFVMQLTWLGMAVSVLAVASRKRWQIIAKIVSHPAVFKWLLARAKRTPYRPILSHDGKVVYMDRWWLFNRYDQGPQRWTWLPAIRIHHIKMRDNDRHMHNHPWRKCRTIILNGWYMERIAGLGNRFHMEGDTLEMSGCRFHKITSVSPDGVYTLFFTWGVSNDWGFLMPDGTTVPWQEYFDKFERGTH